MDENDFDIYLINNNESVKDELIEYKDMCKIFNGNNNIYEFTGIQKCLEYLKKFEIINSYDVSILITDALFNSPMNYLNFINLETIRYVLENEILEHIKSGKKLLGICLGMQLLMEESEELEKTNGLKILKGKVINAKHFVKNSPLPHVG